MKICFSKNNIYLCIVIRKIPKENGTSCVDVDKWALW